MKKKKSKKSSELKVDVANGNEAAADDLETGKSVRSTMSKDPPGHLSSRHVVASPSTSFHFSGINSGNGESNKDASVKKAAYSRRKSSMLEASDDPFAFREGKTLTWRSVNMVLVRSTKLSMRPI